MTSIFTITGTYHWLPKKVAFRNDFCRVCGDKRISFAVRTFDVFHLFFIPILPLGLWRRWYCTVCGNRPHWAPKVTRSVKIGYMLLAVFLGAQAWFLFDPAETDSDFLWTLRIGSPIVFLWALLAFIRRPVDDPFKEKLLAVPPYADQTCPLCGGVLAMGVPMACSGCGAQHRPLRRAEIADLHAG